jgi:hypothetical protein
LPVVASYRSPALFEILSLKVTRVLALRFLWGYSGSD